MLTLFTFLQIRCKFNDKNAAKMFSWLTKSNTSVSNKDILHQLVHMRFQQTLNIPQINFRFEKYFTFLIKFTALIWTGSQNSKR